MTTTLFDKGREGILDRTIDITGDVRVMLVKSAYTFSNAHQFLSDITAGNDNGRSAALASKTYTAGVFDAADTSLVATAAAACNALVLFQHTGSDATARLINYIDNRFQIEIAVTAAGSATALTPEDLPAGIASGATLTLVSGTGPATVTTSASAAAGARALSVTAIASGITAGAVYEYATSDFAGLPFTPGAGQTLNIPWSNGANRIFKL